MRNEVAEIRRKLVEALDKAKHLQDSLDDADIRPGGRHRKKLLRRVR